MTRSGRITIKDDNKKRRQSKVFIGSKGGNAQFNGNNFIVNASTATSSAIVLNASNAAGGIQIDAGSNGIAIETSDNGPINIGTDANQTGVVNIGTTVGRDVTIGNLTGTTIIGGFTFPTSNGSDGQSLTTDGNGTLSWGSGNNNNGSGNVSGPNSSVDNVIVRFDGSTGKVIQTSGITIDDSNVISGATQLNVDNIRIDGNQISSTDANGNIALTPNLAGSVVIDGQSWPQTDGSSNQLLQTDGNGQLSWTSIGPNVATDSGIVLFNGTSGRSFKNSNVTIDNSDVVSGITQLNIDNIRIDGNQISSTDTNGNISLASTGTGYVTLDGQNWPPVNGSSNQFLQTDGNGQLSWTSIGASNSTDNAVVRFDGTNGYTFQDSGIIIDDNDRISGITQLTVDNIRIDGNEITSTLNDGNILLVPIQSNYVLILNGQAWPETDGNANQFLQSNGNDQIMDWRTIGEGVNAPLSANDNAIVRFDGDNQTVKSSGIIIDDNGGITGVSSLIVDEISINADNITSNDFNGNINFSTIGVGNLIIDNQTWPISDGSTNQYLQQGSGGNLRWKTIIDATNSSTDNAIVRYDGTSGNIQNSGILTDNTGSFTAVNRLSLGTTDAPYAFTLETQDNMSSINNRRSGVSMGIDSDNTPNIQFNKGTTGQTFGGVAGFLDFAYTSGGGSDYNYRIICNNSNILRFRSIGGSDQMLQFTNANTMQIDTSEVIIPVVLNLNNISMYDNTIEVTNANGNLNLVSNGTGVIKTNNVPVTHPIFGAMPYDVLGRVRAYKFTWQDANSSILAGHVNFDSVGETNDIVVDANSASQIVDKIQLISSTIGVTTVLSFGVDADAGDNENEYMVWFYGSAGVTNGVWRVVVESDTDANSSEHIHCSVNGIQVYSNSKDTRHKLFNVIDGYICYSGWFWHSTGSRVGSVTFGKLLDFT